MVSKWVMLLMVSMVGLVALVFLSQSALAAPTAPEGGYTTKIVRGDVSWSIPANQCAALPAGVSLNGTGKRFQVIETKVKRDGSKIVISNDFVQGTATDNGSGTYNFIYANQSRYLYPPGAGAVALNMTDSFMLDNTNGTNDYNTGFQWRWTFTPPASEWPPVDNWVQNITIGDSLTCDPI